MILNYFDVIRDGKPIMPSQMANEELEDIIFLIRESTFHMIDDEAKVIVDEYVVKYPQLLSFHDIKWFYKYC